MSNDTPITIKPDENDKLARVKELASQFWHKSKKPLAVAAAAMGGFILYTTTQRVANIEDALELTYHEADDEWVFDAILANPGPAQEWEDDDN